MSFGTLLEEDQRRIILDALQADSDYSHNEEILGTILGHFGHAVSHDKVRTELHWLAEQGLLTLTDNSGVLIAKLTQRGIDVALGRTTAPGVGRPRP